MVNASKSVYYDIRKNNYKVAAYYDQVIHIFVEECYQKIFHYRNEYKNFEKECLNDDKKKDNLRRVYGTDIQNTLNKL